MATSTMVPLEQYLHTSYEHDCEWVDGVVKERGMPDGYHGYFQIWFAAFFSTPLMKLRFRVLTEVRIRISATRYRIPDVLVIPANATFLPSPTVTPLICIEIVSMDERESDLAENARTTWRWGCGGMDRRSSKAQLALRGREQDLSS